MGETKPGQQWEHGAPRAHTPNPPWAQDSGARRQGPSTGSPARTQACSAGPAAQQAGDWELSQEKSPGNVEHDSEGTSRSRNGAQAKGGMRDPQ